MFLNYGINICLHGGLQQVQLSHVTGKSQ